LKFRLEEIPQEGREETISQNQDWLDDRLRGEPNRIFRFASPIQVHLHISRSGGNVIVHSRIQSQAEYLCARCLEPFPLPLKSEITFNLKPKPDFPLPEEAELTREDLETDFYEGEEVDLTSLIQDQILLALPPKGLCREECRGLCPRCGKNLNRETCDCSDGTVDPRFEVLRSFRV
jgi:uncharacterized protein